MTGVDILVIFGFMIIGGIVGSLIGMIMVKVFG